MFSFVMFFCVYIMTSEGLL